MYFSFFKLKKWGKRRLRLAGTIVRCCPINGIIMHDHIKEEGIHEARYRYRHGIQLP